MIRNAVLSTLMLCFSTCLAQSKITGVVTYYFNKYQGDKADLGAKIFVIDSADFVGFEVERFYKYSTCTTFKNVVDLDTSMELFYLTESKKWEKKKRYKDEYDEAVSNAKAHHDSKEKYNIYLVENNCETNEKYASLDKSLSDDINRLKNHKMTMIRTIDATGRYSIELKPSTYYILIQSNNRTKTTISEILGRIHLQKVKIMDGQEKEVSANFKL